MTRRPKRRKPARQPQVFLVGNSGKVSRDKRLRQLRMTKKYKTFLMEQEREKSEKILEMSELVGQYKNLSSLMCVLEKENVDNSNADVLQELEVMRTKFRERLFHLVSMFVDSIPETLYESVQKILKCRVKFSKHEKRVRKSVVSGVTRKSWTAGGHKSQIFIHMSNLRLQTINIDLFSVGNNLYDVLAQELQEDVTKYKLMFGAKEVDKEKPLLEQEIYHGSTIDLITPLLGGMEGRKKKKKTKRRGNKGTKLNQKEEPPLETELETTTISSEMEQETTNAQQETKQEIEKWADPEVKRWFEENNEMFEISTEKVSDLMKLTVNEVNMLKKEEWESISPEYGKLLFNFWQKGHQMLADGAKRNREEERASSSPTVKKKEEVEERSSNLDDSRPNEVPSNQDTPKSSRKVLLGKAESLDETEKEFLIEEFESDCKALIPQLIGNVITVTGVCLSTPNVEGNVATLFIKDDPQGAASFYNKMKILITRGETNKKRFVSLLKDLSTDMHVGVKGRVERFDKEGDVENNHGCKMLEFKLVIDSDDHVLFCVETIPSTLTTQLSQSWWPPHSHSENCNELNLKVGDSLVLSVPENVFCTTKTEPDHILEHVVAFKNTFDGEVFVGVTENGKITGMELGGKMIMKWCEEISIAIGNLLPRSSEGADICHTIQEANQRFERRRCFVCALPLRNDKDRGICWIHVPKGEARLYFIKESDVHAFQRIGAENKRITNYEHLFYDLESLASRKIEQIPEEDYDEEDDEQDEEKSKSKKKYRILKEVRHENQGLEFKMIFGDNPIKTIQQKYLGSYACGFLNSEGGSIFFGIEENEQTKIGHIVGIVVPMEERKQLINTTVETLRNFYPPVSRNQFQIKFHPVHIPSDCIVRDKGEGKMYAMIIGPGDELGKKWSKVIKNVKKSGNSCAVIPLRMQRFCVVIKKETFDGENITELLEQFVKQNSKFKLLNIGETELNTILKNICVIELKIKQSPYPIHMVKPIDTYVFKNDGEKPLCLDKDNLSWKDLMRRFKFNFSSEFNVDHFLEHVKNFDNAGNSYILITSPFNFPENERDLYGLVIPKWTLTIDFDQQPKQPGHLYQLFQTLNDRYQPSRGRFLKTPEDSQLDLNPDHAVCWLAARGYQEDQNTLSAQSHAKWNKTHRSRLRDLLNEELKTSIKPNCLNVVVLWDEGYDTLVQSLQTILEDLMSLNGYGGPIITFICATPIAKSDIDSKIIEPLQEDNWDTISRERIFVAPPYVLARFLSLKLPSPYRPEDDYQVPHKKFFSSGGVQIIPQILPQGLRQNLAGRIDVMYMKKGRKPDEQKLNIERRNFFSGSEITNDGLHGGIAIRRTKINELEKHFKTLAHAKKSQVSLIFVKVDRGAGSTTMCLQFLYEQHRNYPCAQLIEVKDGLVSHIDEINKKTKLPLVLFVDENIAHLPDFWDFKNEVEHRNVNVVFILIEPAEVLFYNESVPGRKVRGQQKTRAKSARDSFLYGPSPYEEVELRRMLDENEMEQLVKILTELTKGKKKELLKFKENARKENKPRTFAEFSLLAFGSEFKGLQKYVKFRLDRADQRQQDILAFLSLTHVFTDYSLPTSTLTHFLGKETIVLEKEMGDKYLQELLSPRVEGSDSRRISFFEVAKEILKQLSGTFTTLALTTLDSDIDPYWNYIQDVSIRIAKYVLSKWITSKKIDRLTRKLFITSEYESEKFSLLIRTMKAQNPDTARDTLKELVEVFSGKEKQSCIRAHLRAHLAKYHMMQYEDFVEAKKLIEAAIGEQGDDFLLHHIHGDIIRLYVGVLGKKLKTEEDMEIIVTYATESSQCFEFVRSKKPHMSHGYMSDAIVRITVMQAGIKLMGGKNVRFVDYLIERIQEIKKSDEKISPNSRYLLSLISDAYDHLDERVIDFAQREYWKETFLECIGDLNNLTRLCDEIQQDKNCGPFIDCSSWLGEIIVQIQILHNALEIENKDLSPHEIEAKLKKLEEYGFHCKFGDRFMKFWIRYSRQRLTVPSLQEVKRRVNEWASKMKQKGIATPQAEFYTFIVHVLIALKNPSDRENMAMAEMVVKQQSKKYNKKHFVLPLEWLRPKNGRHIESIECLLHHDDLIKGTNVSSTSDKRKPIEALLFEKNITQWEGTISAIYSEWQGTITFHRRLPVRFVPQNAQPSMPSQGDTVKFCLSFDIFGLCAWRVMREAGSQRSDAVSRHDDSSSEYSDQEDVQGDFAVSPSLCSIDIPEHEGDQDLDEHKDHQLQDGEVSKTYCSKTNWDDYNEQRMQGVVLSTNPETGYGFIENPDIKGKLFFHASQLRVPVQNLEGNIMKDMLLDFKVEKLTERTRAADIQVLKDENLQKSMLEKLRKKKQPSASSSIRGNESDTRRQEGAVVNYNDRGFGFIRRDSDKSGNNIFFRRRSLITTGPLPKIHDRVEFSVTKDAKGRPVAVDILVQNKSISSNSWNSFIGAGIQEGFVNSTTDDGGTINSSKVTGSKKNLRFSNRDIQNNPTKVCMRAKVHFEVRNRGGRCVAVKINVIDTPEETTQANGGESSFPSNDF